MSTKLIRAGGAVVTREHPRNGTEVVVIHRKRYDDWTLPKGKVENGELLPVTAVREVLEETGVTIRLGSPLDTIRYQTASGLKSVDWWSATALASVRRAPDAEVDVVSWLPLRAALSRLTFSHDHFLVQQRQQQPATTPLILLRHAKAMDRKDWSKKDSARPLNSRGRRQSTRIPPLLRAYGVGELVSSGSARCISTLLPYANAAGLTIRRHDKLSEEDGVQDPAGVAQLVRKIRAGALKTGIPTAVCVHRPVLPAILDALELAPVTLVTGEMLIAHLTAEGEVYAVERHRPEG